MSMKTHRITWADARAYARQMATAMPKKCLIHGIPRGGVNVAQLIETEAAKAGLDIRITDTPEEAQVIVDDIVDSGKTRKAWTSRFPDKLFLTMVGKQRGDGIGPMNLRHIGHVAAGWVVFPWETEKEAEGAEDAVRRLLQAIGENPDRVGLQDTPKRFVRAMRELTRGLHETPEEHLLKQFPLDDVEAGLTYDQIILSAPLAFVSLCEHHLLPFFGHAYLAYLPRPEGKVVGLSKLGRLLDGYANRLQVQERMTQQIANALQTTLNPLGSAVIVKGKHMCQCIRGVKKDGYMTTSAVHGVFKESLSVKEELFNLIRLGE